MLHLNSIYKINKFFKNPLSFLKFIMMIVIKDFSACMIRVYKQLFSVDSASEISLASFLYTFSSPSSQRSVLHTHDEQYRVTR